MANGKTRMGVALGAKIKARRLELNLKQDDLAAKLGVEVNTVSRMECGTHLPSLSRLEQVALVLDVSVAFLLGDAATSLRDQAEMLQGNLEGLTNEERALILDIAKQQADYFKDLARQKKSS